MKRFYRGLLGVLFSFCVACAAADNVDGFEEETGEVQSAIPNHGTRGPQPQGCSVGNDRAGTRGPISDGIRDGNWCCGTAECTDPELCGSDYGKRTRSCADCSYNECIPRALGSTQPRSTVPRAPTRGTVLRPAP